jgi:hypothetical protein
MQLDNTGFGAPAVDELCASLCGWDARQADLSGSRSVGLV